MPEKKPTPAVEWSDGRMRRGDGDTLYRAIREYCGAKLDEELLDLKWENEYMREVLARGKVKSATAG